MTTLPVDTARRPGCNAVATRLPTMNRFGNIAIQSFNVPISIYSPLVLEHPLSRFSLWNRASTDLTSDVGIVPRVRRSTFGARAFAIAGPTVWNSLPDSLRDPAVGPDQCRRDLT